MEALAALQFSRHEIILHPRPGPKIRSGVFVPTQPKKDDALAPSTSADDGMVDLDDL